MSEHRESYIVNEENKLFDLSPQLETNLRILDTLLGVEKNSVERYKLITALLNLWTDPILLDLVFEGDKEKMSKYVDQVSLKVPLLDASSHLKKMGIQSCVEGLGKARTLFAGGKKITLDEDAIGSADSLIDLAVVCYIKQQNPEVDMTARYCPVARRSLYEQERLRLVAETGAEIPDYDEYKSTSLPEGKIEPLVLIRNIEDEFDIDGVSEGVSYALSCDGRFMAADAQCLADAVNKYKCEFTIKTTPAAWITEQNSNRKILLGVGFETLPTGGCRIGNAKRAISTPFREGPEHEHKVEEVVNFLGSVLPQGYEYEGLAPIHGPRKRNKELGISIECYSRAPAKETAKGVYQELLHMVSGALESGGGRKLASMTSELKSKTPVFNKANNPFRTHPSTGAHKIVASLNRKLRDIKFRQRGMTLDHLVEEMATQFKITHDKVGAQRVRGMRQSGKEAELKDYTLEEYRLFALEVIISSPTEFVPHKMERKGNEFVMPRHSELAVHEPLEQAKKRQPQKILDSDSDTDLSHLETSQKSDFVHAELHYNNNVDSVSPSEIPLLWADSVDYDF